MKRISRLLIVTLAVIATAGTAAAQTSSGVLNILDVQRLVAAATPAAHAALGKHFVALAHTYATDAARFRGLATAPAGNPNHTMAVRPGARRLPQAEAAAQLEESARAMAAYHQLLSLGAPTFVPADRALFDGGLGATLPTVAEVETAAAAARGDVDHRALAEYFLIVEARETAAANTHVRQARLLRVSGQRSGADIAALHCDRLARLSRAAAKDASTSATMHRQLANIG